MLRMIPDYQGPQLAPRNPQEPFPSNLPVIGDLASYFAHLHGLNAMDRIPADQTVGKSSPTPQTGGETVMAKRSDYEAGRPHELRAPFPPGPVLDVQPPRPQPADPRFGPGLDRMHELASRIADANAPQREMPSPMFGMAGGPMSYSVNAAKRADDTRYLVSQAQDRADVTSDPSRVIEAGEGDRLQALLESGHPGMVNAYKGQEQPPGPIGSYAQDRDRDEAVGKAAMLTMFGLGSPTMGAVIAAHRAKDSAVSASKAFKDGRYADAAGDAAFGALAAVGGAMGLKAPFSFAPSQVVSNPAVYEHAPYLKDMPVTITDKIEAGRRGPVPVTNSDPVTGMINLSIAGSPQDTLRAAIKQGQYKIQQQEGFASAPRHKGNITPLDNALNATDDLIAKNMALNGPKADLAALMSYKAHLLAPYNEAQIALQSTKDTAASSILAAKANGKATMSPSAARMATDDWLRNRSAGGVEAA